jgi:hypothetical protein
MQIELSRQLIRLASAATCFLLAACGTMAEAQSGLLLGLHRECGEGPCETEYRTLWIAPQAGTLQIMELPDLIVPRMTGFWRVGVRSYCHPKGTKYGADYDIWSNVAFFAKPVSQRPIVQGLVECPEPVQTPDAAQRSCEDADYDDGEDGIDVQFVNRDYISLRKWARNGPCAPHPDGSDFWSVQRLGDSAMTPIPYSDIEGKGASDEYERRAADALIDQNSRDNDEGRKVRLGEGDTEDDKEIRKSFPNWSTMNQVQKVAAMGAKDDSCFPKHDDKEWYIARNHGQWSAHGSFDTHRLCGVLVDFELPFHARFAAPAMAPISLDAIRNRITIKDVSDLKTVKGVKDLFWSPNHEFLVVLINMDKSCIGNPYRDCLPRESDPEHAIQTLLQVYSPHGQDLGKPVISMQLKEFEGPVMAEWATGSNVARWSAELKKIKTQGVVKPLLSLSPHP